MHILKKNSRSAFVLAEALLALAIVTVAVLAEAEDAKNQQTIVRREKARYRQTLKAKQEALENFQQVRKELERKNDEAQVEG
ncbi:hypothetical protein [Fructobacillus papyrifericola]|uniref:Uncharacterized protein n=1 Tax=Fructobacillus papyrifericola TaxID=2713172 RepID=A0ABS5QR99_9LACO|nr:hypothetical protein [Fructobacillus papyrifericola]MBS9335651.1 hypothetical protein [Fructobacillus papyrifericola]